jgi:hypothetical protein
VQLAALEVAPHILAWFSVTPLPGFRIVVLGRSVVLGRTVVPCPNAAPHRERQNRVFRIFGKMILGRW